MVRADGSGRRQLTRGASLGFDLSWAPDGKMVVFEDLATDSVVVADLAGRQRQLDRGSAPSWSPNGRWIAYLSSDERDSSSLALIRPSGMGRRVVDVEGPVRNVEGWSPDSRYILYTRSAGRRRGTQLWRSDTSGEATLIPTGPPGRIEGASWSPNGEWIVYSRKADEQGMIELVRVGDGDYSRKRLTGVCCHEDPDWSPNARSIAFTSLNGISVLGLGKSQKERIAPEPYFYVSDPDWAPC